MIDDAEFLTTRELADLLRLKERKIYDLASSGEVPCVRVVGKLLFPRAEIAAWMANARSGPAAATTLPPNVLAGSHDPLLEWALRESGSGLAAFFDGSADGLDRLARRESVAAGAHLHEPGGWNVGALESRLPGEPLVLIEFARRSRGLVVAPGNPLGIRGIADLADRRFGRRQQGAASQRLFEAIAADAAVDPHTLAGPDTPARTEDDVALMVLDGKADAVFGLAAMAHQFRLGFVPVIEERYDIAIWRRAYFEPPLQTLLAFLNSEPFRQRAAEFTGYDVSRLGSVHYNGPGP